MAQELRFFDVAVDDAVIAAGGTIAADSTNKLAQGTLEEERVGRRATLVRLDWRYTVELPLATASADTGDVVRVVLYLDKQCNGASAAVTDILSSAAFDEHILPVNQDRFELLYDATHDMIPRAGGLASGSVRWGPDTLHEVVSFEVTPIEVEFSGTTGAIDEILSNNVGVMLLSRDGHCTFVSKLRWWFLA